MSEFEEVFEENYRFYIDDSCEYRYANQKNSARQCMKPVNIHNKPGLTSCKRGLIKQLITLKIGMDVLS